MFRTAQNLPELDYFTHCWMGRLSPRSNCRLVALNSVCGLVLLAPNMQLKCPVVPDISRSEGDTMLLKDPSHRRLLTSPHAACSLMAQEDEH